MADYQVHVLDVWGRIVRTVGVECDDDDQARVIAEDQTGLVPMEIWQDDRLIERYESVLKAYPRLSRETPRRRPGEAAESAAVEWKAPAASTSG